MATGFMVSKTDNSLFILRSGARVLYVLVYVDDIIITGSDSQAIDSFVTQLNDRFSLKDQSKLNYFLGIEV